MNLKTDCSVAISSFALTNEIARRAEFVGEKGEERRIIGLSAIGDR